MKLWSSFICSRNKTTLHMKSCFLFVLFVVLNLFANSFSSKTSAGIFKCNGCLFCETWSSREEANSDIDSLIIRNYTLEEEKVVSKIHTIGKKTRVKKGVRASGPGVENNAYVDSSKDVLSIDTATAKYQMSYRFKGNIAPGLKECVRKDSSGEWRINLSLFLGELVQDKKSHEILINFYHSRVNMREHLEGWLQNAVNEAQLKQYKENFIMLTDQKYNLNIELKRGIWNSSKYIDSIQIKKEVLHPQDDTSRIKKSFDVSISNCNEIDVKLSKSQFRMKYKYPIEIRLPKNEIYKNKHIKYRTEWNNGYKATLWSTMILGSAGLIISSIKVGEHRNNANSFNTKINNNTTIAQSLEYAKKRDHAEDKAKIWRNVGIPVSSLFLSFPLVTIWF